MVAPQPSGTNVVCRQCQEKLTWGWRFLYSELVNQKEKIQNKKPKTKTRCTSQMQLNEADCGNFANISQVIMIKSVI